MNGRHVVEQTGGIPLRERYCLQFFRNLERGACGVRHQLHIGGFPFGPHLAALHARHRLRNKRIVAQYFPADCFGIVPAVAHNQMVNAERFGHPCHIPHPGLTARKQVCLCPVALHCIGQCVEIIIGMPHRERAVGHGIHSGKHKQLPVDGTPHSGLGKYTRSIERCQRRIEQRPVEVGRKLLPFHLYPYGPGFKRIPQHHHKIVAPHQSVGRFAHGIAETHMLASPARHKVALLAGDVRLHRSGIGHKRAGHSVNHRHRRRGKATPDLGYVVAHATRKHRYDGRHERQHPEGAQVEHRIRTRLVGIFAGIHQQKSNHRYDRKHQI